MATTQDLMNKVLRGLRQDVVVDSDTTDRYELLVLQFVNEAKEEVEEAWSWQSLRQTVTLTATVGVAEYALTVTSGNTDIATNERSRLLYEKGINSVSESTSRGFGSQPAVWDVTDSGERRLKEVSWEKMERLHLSDDDEQNDPSYFAVLNTGQNLKMKLWPTPADTRTIKMRLFIPQAELASNVLDTTTLTVPARPVWTLALWKANAERGEEIAQPGGFNEMAYRQALAAAIAREQSMDDITSYPV